MKNIYYVHTGNRHGQILAFESKRSARAWMRKATRLDDAQIDQSIYRAPLTACGHYDIWPQGVAAMH